ERPQRIQDHHGGRTFHVDGANEERALVDQSLGIKGKLKRGTATVVDSTHSHHFERPVRTSEALHAQHLANETLAFDGYDDTAVGFAYTAFVADHAGCKVLHPIGEKGVPRPARGGSKNEHIHRVVRRMGLTMLLQIPRRRLHEVFFSKL